MSDDTTPLCVLLIEDDHDTQQIVRDVLEHFGITLWVASDMDSTVRAIEEHDPDVIVLDIFLPDTTGYKILEAIRSLEHGKPYPVIASTGYYTIDTAESVAAYGFDGYLPKPYDPKQLIAALYANARPK